MAGLMRRVIIGAAMVMATVFSCQRRPHEVRKELLDIRRIKRANYRGKRSLIPTTAGHSSSPLPPLARVIALRCGIGPWLSSESICPALGAVHPALVTTARNSVARKSNQRCNHSKQHRGRHGQPHHHGFLRVLVARMA